MKIEATLHDDNFHDAVLAAAGPVVVVFTATWCWPCLRYEPVLAAAHAAFGRGIRLMRMDIDKNRVIPTRYGVVNVPTLLLFHRGKLLKAIEGIRDQGSLVETFRTLAAQTVEGSPTTDVVSFNLDSAILRAPRASRQLLIQDGEPISPPADSRYGAHEIDEANAAEGPESAAECRRIAESRFN